MVEPRTPAIVLANGLNGLCTVRSLGAAGVPVWALAHNPNQPCARSRYCELFLRKPGEALVESLARLRSAHGVSTGVLLATSDEGAQEIASERASLPPGVLFAGPDRRVVELLMDKRLEISVVQGVTDCLPRSLATLVDTPDDIIAALTLPIIFKPRTQRLADALRLKNRVAATREEVSAFYEQFASQLDSFVAQEVIPGNDSAIWQCNAVFNTDNTLISAFTFQKLGMAPPHFGVTTLGISTRSPDVVSLTQQIGKALGYTGPAGFEFKLDARDQRLKYIEVNPRFAMANWFDTQCGVNTAYNTYQLALGNGAPRDYEQQEGVYFIDLYADSYSRLIDDGESLAAVFMRYVRMLGSRRIPAYWNWRDPVPAFAATVRKSSQVLRAVRKRLGS